MTTSESAFDFIPFSFCGWIFVAKTVLALSEGYSLSQPSKRAKSVTVNSLAITFSSALVNAPSQAQVLVLSQYADLPSKASVSVKSTKDDAFICLRSYPWPDLSASGSSPSKSQ